MTETQFQTVVMTLFRTAGCEVIRIMAGTAGGGRRHGATRGAPDLMVGGWGKWVGVECKVDGGKLRPEQAETMARWGRKGLSYRVVWSLADAMAVLKGMKG